jgi:Fis family transcriptional regulator
MAREKKTTGPCLAKHVESSLETYFEQLNGHKPAHLYEVVIGEIERPLLSVVMAHTDGNLTRAAEYLGMNRATLRKKLAKHGIEP